jgi:hypothetical protein
MATISKLKCDAPGCAVQHEKPTGWWRISINGHTFSIMPRTGTAGYEDSDESLDACGVQCVNTLLSAWFGKYACENPNTVAAKTQH